MKLAKDLGNLPGNVCTPSYLGEEARQLAAAFGADAEILGPKEIAELGMALSVRMAGSVEEARLIVLATTAPRTRPTSPSCWWARALPSTSGGISLKPGEGMDEMKYDMCGAATVLALSARRK